MIKKWRIRKDNIVFSLLLIPYLEPLLFKESQYSFFDKIYTMLKIICLVFIVVFFIKYNVTKNKCNKCTILILILELITFLSTIIHNGDLVKYFGPAVSVVALTLITEVYLRRLKTDFFRIARNILLFLTLINVLLQIKYPSGILPEINFLGIDNRLVFFYIPLVFFAILYDFSIGSELSFLTYVILLICMWSTISLWAVGGFLGIILMSLSVILSDKTTLLKKITMRKLIIVDILLNISVVFLQIQKYFATFIVGTLQKDLTLTGRTYLWDWAIDSIREYPILGYGIQSDEYLLNNIYHWVVHPHNMFLNYLTTVGIIGFFIYLMILFLTAKLSQSIGNLKIKICCSVTVFVLLFLSIADTLDTGTFYMIYLVINMLPLLSSKKCAI